MILNFEQLTQAKEEVEKIISLPTAKIKDELINSAKHVDKDKKREYYRHMSSLFLNIILNRLDELGPDAKDKSFEARKDIVDIVKTL